MWTDSDIEDALWEEKLGNVDGVPLGATPGHSCAKVHKFTPLDTSPKLCPLFSWQENKNPEIKRNIAGKRTSYQSRMVGENIFPAKGCACQRWRIKCQMPSSWSLVLLLNRKFYHVWKRGASASAGGWALNFDSPTRPFKRLDFPVLPTCGNLHQNSWNRML